MQPNILEDAAAKAPWSAIHPLTEEDSVAAAALRSVVASVKGAKSPSHPQPKWAVERACYRQESPQSKQWRFFSDASSCSAGGSAFLVTYLATTRDASL